LVPDIPDLDFHKIIQNQSKNADSSFNNYSHENQSIFFKSKKTYKNNSKFKNEWNSNESSNLNLYKNNYNHSYSSKAYVSRSMSNRENSDSRENILLKKAISGFTTSNINPDNQKSVEHSKDFTKKNSIFSERKINPLIERLQKKKTIFLSELYNQLNRFDYYKDIQSKVEEKPINLKTQSRKYLDVDESIRSNDKDIDIHNSYMKYQLSKTNRATSKVFWPMEKMENIREKFRTASEKIKKKTEKDFYELSVAIKYGDRDYILLV